MTHLWIQLWKLLPSTTKTPKSTSTLWESLALCLVCELKDQTRQSELWESPLIDLNDSSENFSDGHYSDIETNDLTSEVYMRSLTAAFSHPSTPVAK